MTGVQTCALPICFPVTIGCDGCLQAEVDVPVDADIVLGVDGSFSGDTTAIVAVTVP